MLRRFSRVAILLVLFLVTIAPVFAQEATLKLTMSRDFGYGGMGQIQGLFSLKASGPEDLQRVDFFIDDQALGEDTEAPFKFQFHTDSFPPGMRRLTAVAVTASGAELRSNEIQVEFLSQEAAESATTKVIVPILGLGALILVAMVAATLLSARRRGRVPLGQPRSYGAFGGTICLKCGRPFALSLLGLNAGLGKLTACPHCGKWSVVRRVPLEALRAAEEAELASAGDGAMAAKGDEGDDLRKALDDSRYT